MSVCKQIANSLLKNNKYSRERYKLKRSSLKSSKIKTLLRLPHHKLLQKGVKAVDWMCNSMPLQKDARAVEWQSSSMLPQKDVEVAEWLFNSMPHLREEWAVESSSHRQAILRHSNKPSRCLMFVKLKISQKLKKKNWKRMTILTTWWTTDKHLWRRENPMLLFFSISLPCRILFLNSKGWSPCMKHLKCNGECHLRRYYAPLR